MTPILTVKADGFDARPGEGARAGAPNAAPLQPVAVPAQPPPTLERVIAEHQDRVRRLARRLSGWSEDAEDVVQDVFVAVLENLPRFRGDSSVATWVTAITLNRCRAHRRRRMIRMAFVAKARRAPPREMAAAAHPSDHAERDERVRQAVRRLPARDREVVVLRHLEQMDLDDVAAIVGATRAAVEVRLHRARAKLKTMLGDLMDEA
jgi:RNA polymerase sigma-70 factor (ECF subfamily)